MIFHELCDRNEVDCAKSLNIRGPDTCIARD